MRLVEIEFRWAEGKYERIDGPGAELVASRVDRIVTHGGPGAVAASRATSSIPIVFASTGDVVGTGLVTNLARPGRNMTGSTFFVRELNVKRIGLLKEVLPRLTEAAILTVASPGMGEILQAMEAAATSLKMRLHRFEVAGPAGFEAAFAAIAKKRSKAVLIPDQSAFVSQAKAIADLARAKRLASIGFSGYATAGGTPDYGANFLELWRRTGYFVDKILKGTKPGDIPIEQAAKFETAVNLNTAKALGIEIPRSILQRADRTID